MPFDSEISQKSLDQIRLEKARARIARGWCQNIGWENGSVCASAALSEVLGYAQGEPWELPSSLAMEHDRLCQLLDFEHVAQLVTWNDTRGRTQEEVLARFDAAIERLSAR